MRTMTRQEMANLQGGGPCGAAGALAALFCGAAFASFFGAIIAGPSCAGLLLTMVAEC